MRFQSVLYLGLAASAVSAAPSVLAPADMPTIQSSFDKIIVGIDKMVGLVNAFDGDKSKVPIFLAASSAIEKEVSDGAAAIKKSPAMAFADVLNILGPTTLMQTKVDS